MQFLKKIESNKMKKCFIINIICLSILFLSVACRNNNEIEGKDWVAKVDNEKISLNEFNHFVKKNRAVVYNYFSQKYSLPSNKDFWTTEFNGEQPDQYLKQKSLDECVKVKVQQMLARDKNLIDDISYSAFLDKLKRENERRQLAVESKKVVYGPVNFSEQAYFSYYFSNLIIELKQKFAANEFDLSDNKLRDYYELHKDTLYKREDRVKIGILSLRLDSEKPKLKLQNIKERLNKGERLKLIAEDYADQASYQIMEFDSSNSRMHDRLNLAIKNAAMKLQPEEFADLSNVGIIKLVKCIEREKGGYVPYKKVNQIVKTNYIDKMYTAIIKEKLTDVKIEINESVYKAIEIK